MMESREFALYSYQLDSTMNSLVGSAIVALFLAIGGAAALTPWSLLLLLIPVAVFVYVKRSGCSKPLLIASRYLILGERIIYFRNVSRAVLDNDKQTLTLSSNTGKSVIIAAEKFPTNARKPDKIRINKGDKFRKVSDKIMARVRALSPQCIMS